MFCEVVNFPSFLLEHDVSQLLHLRCLLVKRFRLFLQMVVDCDLLVEEAVVQGEELVHRLEHDRVHHAHGLQKDEEIFVFLVLVVLVFMLENVVVLFGLPQLIAKVVQVPLGEHTLQVQMRRLERLIVH